MSNNDRRKIGSGYTGVEGKKSRRKDKGKTKAKDGTVPRGGEISLFSQDSVKLFQDRVQIPRAKSR
jgi:hypothetical protein